MNALSANLLHSLQELMKRYEDAIIQNPSLATRTESILKLASYIIPGYLSKGGGRGALQLSELGYCISNLYKLFNDYAIAKRCRSSSRLNSLPLPQQRLLWLLALMENTEVVLELFGDFIYREFGKWVVILWMRIIKAAMQCVIVFHYRSRILTSPSVPNIDRAEASIAQSPQQPDGGQPTAYLGRRTGKIIRSIHSDPRIPYSELQAESSSDAGNRNRELGLSTKQLVAEGLHISRPLVHLFSMVLFQESSWKPWLISLTMDVISLHLHGGLVQFKTIEPSETLRRRLVLLLYLLRSPFYEKHTKAVLFAFLQYIASHVPLTSWIISWCCLFAHAAKRWDQASPSKLTVRKDMHNSVRLSTGTASLTPRSK